MTFPVGKLAPHYEDARAHLRAHRKDALLGIGHSLAGAGRSLVARLTPDPPAVDAELLPPGWVGDDDESGWTPGVLDTEVA